MPDTHVVPTDRRALLAGIGGLAAGTFLMNSRAEAGSLTPPGAPAPSGKPLSEVEPRVAVNAINTPTDGFAMHLISQPGSYYLTNNISFGPEKAGILIDASNVALDLNGFSIIGAGPTSSAAGVAVASERTDVMVHNGFIADCRHAVYGEESPGRVVVRNLHVRATQFEAIFLSNQCIVEDCTVIDGGSVSMGEDCRVSRCLVQGGGYAGISVGGHSVVELCKVAGTSQEGISARDGCVVENNLVHGCGAGIRVAAGSNSVIRNNTVLSNTGAGLRVDTAGNTVSGNTVRGNGTNYQFETGNHLELLISQIPQTLSWPCMAMLQGTLTGVAGQSGITIASDDVTVDLGGHALIGVAQNEVDLAAVLVSLFVNRKGVTVRNGTVRNWYCGVNVNWAPESVVEGIQAVDCASVGIFGGAGSVVRGCTASGSELCFHMEAGGVLADCSSSGGARGFQLGNGVSVSNCTARQSGANGFIGYHASLEHCTASQCSTGFELEGATVRGCTASGCVLAGFLVSRCNVSHCQAYESGGPGYAAINSLLVNNNASICGVLSNTVADPGCAFALNGGTVAEGNTAFDNLRGFVVRGGRNVLVRNRAGVSTFENWDIAAGNVVAPIIHAGTNGPQILGDSWPGTYSTTHPDANITH